MSFRLLWAISCFVLIYSIETLAATTLAPGPKDKCPVCGMFTSKYQDFLGVIELEGGERLWFDGAKDFFKYYLNPTAYGQGQKNALNYKVILVTDYYAVKLIDARSAWYVIGSDVFGPMGHELIPFTKEADAREFMIDHGGQRLLLFNEINFDILKGLE